jgi:hypothetical protein
LADSFGPIHRFLPFVRARGDAAEPRYVVDAQRMAVGFDAGAA